MDFYKLIEEIYQVRGFRFTNDDIDVFKPLLKPVTFCKNDVIVGIGEKTDKLYFIISGVARSYYIDNSGNDITKNFSDELSFCVGESLFSQEKSVQGFEALTDIEAFEIEPEKFKKTFMSNQRLTMLYISMLEFSLLYKTERESSFQLKSATERYIDFKREFPTLENRINQSYIATYLGITPVSLSRIRRTLRGEN